MKTSNLIAYNQISPVIDSSAMIFDGVYVIGDVKIGKECSIWFGSVLRGDESSIEIGDRTNIQDLSIVHVGYKEDVGGGKTIIGDDVTIGHHCIIHACEIANLCLIGMGSVIMNGAKIGENSIVGARSLVTKDKVFPPKSLIMGNPAKFIRELTLEEIESIKQSAFNYVHLAKSYEFKSN